MNQKAQAPASKSGLSKAPAEA